MRWASGHGASAGNRAARVVLVVIVALCLGVAGMATVVVSAPPARADECFSWDFPDPSVMRVDGTYVTYSTRSWLGQMPVMSSADGCVWDFKGDALPRVGRWAVGGDHVWAPSVVAVPGGFHMYYAARHRDSGLMCIGIATSATWQGPFGDGDAGPVVCPTPSGGAIDPSVFTDTGGQRYLLWKNDGNCCGVGTNLWSTPIDDGGHPSAPSASLLGSGRGWHGTPGGPVVEQPEMVAANGHHLLFYSGGAWNTGGYGIGYASCAGPLGPCWDQSPGPLLQNAGRGVGAGGLSVVRSGAGRFDVVYHAWVGAVGYPEGARALFFDHLVVDAWGTPRIGADPFGSLDAVASVPGPTPQISLSGWSLDPDGAAATQVHVYVDRVGAAVLVAGTERGDVGTAFPGYGSGHGFSATVPVTAGAHEVCAFAVNAGLGTSNPSLGCRRVVVDRNPFGALDTVVAPFSTTPTLTVSGWAIDPDSAAPIQAHVYVDGYGVPVVAGGSRPDVGAAFPGYGSAHGFGATVAVQPGRHRVCVFGINAGPGDANPPLGCRDVDVGRAPVGSLDEVTRIGDAVVVHGWAIDPDTTGSVETHVYVDAAGVPLRAAGARPDVGLAYPGYGPAHGFDALLALPPGPHQVCAYAINFGPGPGSTTLRCTQI